MSDWRLEKQLISSLEIKAEQIPLNNDGTKQGLSILIALHRSLDKSYVT